MRRREETHGTRPTPWIPEGSWRGSHCRGEDHRLGNRKFSDQAAVRPSDPQLLSLWEFKIDRGDPPRAFSTVARTHGRWGGRTRTIC